MLNAFGKWMLVTAWWWTLAFLGRYLWWQMRDADQDHNVKEALACRFWLLILGGLALVPILGLK